jgi:hypothetical protein
MLAEKNDEREALSNLEGLGTNLRPSHKMAKAPTGSIEVENFLLDVEKELLKVLDGEDKRIEPE